MMHARFYQIYRDRADQPMQLMQALGSDSIIYLEDYLTPQGRHKVILDHAASLNRKDGLNKGYVGYAIFTGSSLFNSTPRYATIFPTAIEYIEVCRNQRAMI